MVRQWVNSVFGSVSYRVGRVLVDAGDVWPGFEGVEAVLLTHAHFDHIYGLNAVLARNPGVRVYTNEAGRAMLADARKNLSRYHELPFVFTAPERVVCVADGDCVMIAGARMDGVTEACREDCIAAEAEGLKARAVFTPGHNASCITWVVGGLLFTGDAWIPGLKTVTNLPGGNKVLAAASEELIRGLAQGRTVCPGHRVDELKS